MRVGFTCVDHFFLSSPGGIVTWFRCHSCESRNPGKKL